MDYQPYYNLNEQYVILKPYIRQRARNTTNDTSDDSTKSYENKNEENNENSNINSPMTLQYSSWTSKDWQTQNNDMGKDHILISNYGPSGNLIGKPIYEIDKACSNCPPASICHNGLCL